MRRIHQDIQNMHRDLRDQITAVHTDVRRLTGDILPDAKRAERPLGVTVRLLSVPSVLVDKFTKSALADKECLGLTDLKLEHLSDALMFNFEKLPKKLEDLDTEASSPSLETRYLSLMKCLWLFSTMRDLMKTSSTGPDSHWPGYLRQFEKDLCIQCEQFELDNAPEIVVSLVGLDSEALSLWPGSEGSLLDDIVVVDEDMEELLNSPLVSRDSNTQRHVTLLRRPGSKDRPLCAIVSGRQLRDNTRQKPQTMVIDFNWTSTILNPHYALPTNSGLHNDMVLQRNGKAAKLEFISLADVFKFQQAVTGFKPWGAYCEYNIDVTFVVGGRQDPIGEKACAQLWYPKATMAVTKPSTTQSLSSARSVTRATAAASFSSASTDSASSLQSFVHQQPTKPMLVLFTQGKGKDKDKLSIVTIDVGSGTKINPGRCDCRYSGKIGLGCLITAIENRKRASYLDARRYETGPNGEVGWNLTRLAQANSPSATKKWHALKRVTLKFQTLEAREKFSGTLNQCQCRNEKQGELVNCLKLGHRGLWGEVQEFHRRQMIEYHQARYLGQEQLIYRPYW
jgi:hypothetical protein